uniref:Tripartite motif-containing protein 2 n=1 Tax=Magallana gigas TaxID=29159 RepID=A0A8W8JMB8_MAGGI
DAIVKILKANADKLESNARALLDKQEIEIQQSIAEIKQSIADVRKLLEHNDVVSVSAYKTRNNEFRRLPYKAMIPLPSIYPYKIDKEPIYKHFKSLSPLIIRMSGGYNIDDLLVKPAPTIKQFMNEPQIVSYIKTKSASRKLSCLNDEEIWTSNSLMENTMDLYNIDGDLVQSIQTKSGYPPIDITATKSGDLVYTDRWDRSVNIVRNTHIETVILLHGWVPCCVCCTSSDDLLIGMNSEDCKQSKVVRYSGFREKQSIQYDDKGQPLYSESFGGFYIAENINQDICVTCSIEVVVVNKDGKLRFRYTGHPFTTFKEEFDPRGITTDSHGRILIADSDNHCIHVIDQDGEFLRYIDNCKLHRPISLCVDSEDNLFVPDGRGTMEHEVKEIQYYMTK